MLAEFCQDEEINQKANAVYQQMIASLLSAWNQGLYVANPPRCKGWDQLYTGARRLPGCTSVIRRISTFLFRD